LLLNAVLRAIAAERRHVLHGARSTAHLLQVCCGAVD